MFLTKKSLRKIHIITACFFAIGAVLLLEAILSALLGSDVIIPIVLGALCVCMGLLTPLIGRYAEGTAKLLNDGNRLVYHDLRPAEFLREYEKVRTSPDVVVSKPDFNVLRLVAVAYDILDDTENALLTAEEMVTTTAGKKNTLAKLFKVSLLFDAGRTEEAEKLFIEVQREKMNATAKVLSDAILKSDRAMAMGDYAVAEAFERQLLARSFPKNTPLVILMVNHRLAVICSRTGCLEEAKEYYRYCAENGGETAIRADAIAALEVL